MNELDLFAAAIATDDPTKRAELLDRECSGRPDLRQRLDLLLDAHARSHQSLDAPNHSDPSATVAHATDPSLVDAIIAGRYKLLEEIGEGGMGTVWMAEQREPVKRLVALKLIKPGMDSRSVLARFEAERQALALMDHPNIAKVLDGGTTAEGRPYFVMELVKGLPLNEYCDARRLSIRDRLKLFGLVCSAVQHAHQKGVIHRDLKPTNVLVTEHDGQPVPKVIDFGLAKALNTAGALTDKTLHTAFGSVVGTPLYMAPEQVGINALDVDTRTDVYALGVLLYELLTGTTPLEKKQLREAAWEEMRRLIREEEPPRPSARLSTSVALPSLAADRQIEPARLTKLVRGELDWIVMKALEKDRNRRYETANGLAMDVQRHLNGEPVLAVPPSAGYRLRKFARKNRAALTTGAAFLFILMSSVAFSTYQAMRALLSERRARDAMVEAVEAYRASEAAKQAAEQKHQEAEMAREAEAEQRRLAEANADKARLTAAAEKSAREAAESRKAETDAVLGFMDDLFANARDRSLRRAVELALGFLDDPDFTRPPIKKEDRYFYKQPLIEASVRLQLGRLLLSWQEHDRARQQFQRAYDLRESHLGPLHPVTIDTIDDLAESFVALGRGDEAIELRAEALAQCRTQLGLDAPLTVACIDSLANSYAAQDLHAEALVLIDEFLAKANRAGVDLWRIRSALTLRLRCSQKRGDVSNCRTSAEMWEKLSDDDSSSLYNAACFRAVTAALQAKAKAPDATPPAKVDADKAMAWLTKAVAAGYTAADHIKKDTDLDFLRDRDDFKALLAELEARSPPTTDPAVPALEEK